MHSGRNSSTLICWNPHKAFDHQAQVPRRVGTLSMYEIESMHQIWLNNIRLFILHVFNLKQFGHFVVFLHLHWSDKLIILIFQFIWYAPKKINKSAGMLRLYCHNIKVFSCGELTCMFTSRALRDHVLSLYVYVCVHKHMNTI